MDGTGKVQGSVIAGALSTIAIWALDTYFLPTPMPPEIAAAVATVISGLGAWITPHEASVASLVTRSAKLLPFVIATVTMLGLSACATSSTSPLGNQFATALSRIMNTAGTDLLTTQKVALAATPPDQDGANCAAAAITVQGYVNKVATAAASGGAGAFTVAELASLFQPGSAQFNLAYNTLATGCIAKANDVMGAAGVLAAGGIAGVLAATNTVLPLGAAIP